MSVPFSRKIAAIAALPFISLSVLLGTSFATNQRQFESPFDQDMKKCFAVVDPEWSRAERFAWVELCLGLDVDFDIFDQAKPFTSVDELSKDPNRFLRAQFINEILFRPRYVRDHKITRIAISKARLESLKANNLTLNQLILDNTLIDGDIEISDSEIKYTTQITDSKGHGGLRFAGLTSARVDLSDSSFMDITTSSSNIGTTRLTGLKVKRIQFAGDIVSHQIAIEDSDIRAIYMSGTTANTLSADVPLLNSLTLSNVAFAGTIDLTIGDWSDLGLNNDTLGDEHHKSEMLLYRVAAQKIKIGLTKEPSNVAIVEPDVQAVDLGDKPLNFLKALDSGTSGYEPNVYLAASKFYSDTGRSELGREIQIRQLDDQRHDSAGFDHVVLDLNWALTGYGFVIERGFMWIAGFLLLGYVVFRTGEAKVKGAKIPQSWLYFTLNSVIPLVALNKEYEEVSFTGWRQHYLYFMKVLSAALVFLVIAYIKQTFFDTF